jgi:ubiquinone biosynthesis protein COQ9
MNEFPNHLVEVKRVRNRKERAEHLHQMVASEAMPPLGADKLSK